MYWDGSNEAYVTYVMAIAATTTVGQQHDKIVQGQNECKVDGRYVFSRLVQM